MAHISIFFTTIKVVRLFWIGIWVFSLFLWYVSGRKGTFYNHSHNNNHELYVFLVVWFSFSFTLRTYPRTYHHGLYVFLRGLFDRLFFLCYSQSQIQSTSPQLFWSGFDLINKDKFINVNAMISMMIVGIIVVIWLVCEPIPEHITD